MDWIVEITACVIVLLTWMKLSMLSWKQAGMVGVLYACWTWTITPWVASQPATWLTDWLALRDNRLDIAVCIVLEVCIMLAFCFNCFHAEMQQKLNKIIDNALLFYPGLLLLGVIPYVLSNVLLSFPGTSFTLVQWLAAVVVLALMPLGGWLAKRTGATPFRLEALFVLSLCLLMMGIAVGH